VSVLRRLCLAVVEGAFQVCLIFGQADHEFAPNEIWQNGIPFTDSAAVPVERSAETSGQSQSVEWLGEKTNRSGFQYAHSDGLVGEARNENERHRVSLGQHEGLQLGTAHAWHLDICNYARRVIEVARPQEFFSRRKYVDDVSKRPQEILSSSPNGCVIVNNGNNLGGGHTGLSYRWRAYRDATARQNAPQRAIGESYISFTCATAGFGGH
jgi:hypothetical protein